MSGARVDPAGEEADFLAWLAPAWVAMHRTAHRLAPPGEADDALQNAVLAAWRHRSRFDERRGSALAWLVVITANESRKLHRGRRRTEPLRDDDLLGAAAAPEPAAEVADLRAALARLPGRQARAVELHYYVGLSVKETAAVMGCAEGTVKSTLAAARAALARSLEGEFR